MGTSTNLNQVKPCSSQLFYSLFAEFSPIQPSVITNPTTQEVLPRSPLPTTQGEISPVPRITDDGITDNENELWPTTNVVEEENAANEGELGSKRLTRAYYIVIGLGAVIVIVIIIIIVAVIAYKCRKSRRTYKGKRRIHYTQ